MNQQEKQPVIKGKRTLLRDILMQTDDHTWKAKKAVFQLDQSNSSEEGTVQATFLKKKQTNTPQNNTKNTTNPPTKCKSPSKPLSPKADGLRVGNDWQHY